MNTTPCSIACFSRVPPEALKDQNMSASIATTQVLAAPLTDQLPTDPKPDGYDAVRYNAMKHGILSRCTVLSHENHSDYESLLTALMDEHRPAGATEQHLVEELASIIWRKRRVLQAEGATINNGLKTAAISAKTVVPSAVPFERGIYSASTDIRDLMEMTPAEVADRQREASLDLEAGRQARQILRRGGKGAYKSALAMLVPDSQEWWHDCVAADKYPEDADGLCSFINDCLEPICLQMEKEARYHDDIKNQFLGEGLIAYKLEKLSRYETHLDRKFERTLGMLIKLKELRVTQGSRQGI
jgi:hypothetical protein